MLTCLQMLTNIKNFLKILTDFNKLIHMIQAYRHHHALRFINIFFNIEYNLCPSSPPEAPIVLSQHSSSLSQAQLFLIPSTAHYYPKYSSFLFRAQLLLILHSSFISDAQFFYILCTRCAGAVLRIRKSSALGKRELCLG